MRRISRVNVTKLSVKGAWFGGMTRLDTSLEHDLQSGAEALGIALSSTALMQFVDYARLLREWNSRFNLTRINPKDYATLHFLDSLSVLRALNPAPNQTLIDVGSGAGFPGLPLKIARPDLQITLLDSQRKRVFFLEQTIAELGLSGISALHGRAEVEGKSKPMREKYDFAVARALAPTEVTIELILPFVQIGGFGIALKGPKAQAELGAIERASYALGGQLDQVLNIAIPGANLSHFLVVIRKNLPTPPRYPRQTKRIKASPLG